MLVPTSAGPSLNAPGWIKFRPQGLETVIQDYVKQRVTEPCPLASCRIVVAGALLQRAVVPNSVGIFDFQAAYGLTKQLVCVLPLCGLSKPTL